MIAVDSSVFVALINENDAHHKKAIELLQGQRVESILLFDYIYSEVLSVLKRKTSLSLCREFFNILGHWGMKILMSERAEIEIANGFFFHENNLSFQDCLLIASARLQNAEIITFDEELKSAWNKLKK